MGSEAKNTPTDPRSEAEALEETQCTSQQDGEIKLIPQREILGLNLQGQSNENRKVIADDEDQNNNAEKNVEKEPITEIKDVLEIRDQNVPEVLGGTESSLSSKDVTEEISVAHEGTPSAVLLRKDSHQFCRICHEAGTDDVFISPCKCKGSLSLVHKWCLERWLAESDTNHCELCGFVFNVHRQPKYNVVWSLFLWLWNSAPKRERRLLLGDTILFTIICPLIAFLTIVSFQLAETILVPDINEKITQLQARLGVQWRREDIQLIASLLARLLQMTIISLMITFDVGFASWSILRFQYHAGRWYRWYRRSSDVVLRGYPEIRRPIPVASESMPNIRSVSF